MRHGPHHGAHTSTSTGIVAASTTAAKSASEVSTTHGRGFPQRPQRGAPPATAGTRFFVPQWGHTTTAVCPFVVALMPLPPECRSSQARR